MINEGLKTPLASSINQVASQQAADAIVQLGRALPCHVVGVEGQVVTVRFDVQGPWTLPQVTMPVATSVYDWLPLRPGDVGVTVSSEVYLGGASGLGGGTATFAPVGNLTGLLFVPVSNAGFLTTFENYRVVQGPDGVVVQTLDGSVSLVLNASGVKVNGNLTVTGETSFGGGAKKVVLDGDPVVGGGGGTVQASSTTIKAT